MFDKFGEFDSAEEINAAAAGQLEQGDIQAIYDMAEENGIDKDDVDDYVTGNYPKLTNTFLAAYGKLEIEIKNINICEIMEDWVEYIKIQLEGSEEMQRALRKKDKSLKGCIAALLKWSFAHQYPISDEIKKAAGVTAGKVTLGIPGMGTAKKVITEYYLGK